MPSFLSHEIMTMQFHLQKIRNHDPENGIFGDCHRTAIACLLDKQPEEIPNFAEHWNIYCKFAEETNKYLATQGLREITIPFIGDLEEVLEAFAFNNKDAYYILGGSSKVADHSVICCHNKIIWDPATGEKHSIIGPMSNGYYYVSVLVPTRFNKI